MGSIVGLSNADVARLVSAPIVLVVNGGIGKAFDEVCLNKSFIESKGGSLMGVIANKVFPDKADEIGFYLSEALETLSLPLFGVIPDRDFFERAALLDYERLFDTRLLCGENERYRHCSSLSIVTVDSPDWYVWGSSHVVL